MNEAFTTINLGVILGGPLDLQSMQIEPEWQLGSTLKFESASNPDVSWAYTLVALPASGEGALITPDGGFHTFDDGGRDDIVHVARLREGRIGHALLHRASWEAQSAAILEQAEQAMTESQREVPPSEQVTTIPFDDVAVEHGLVQLP